MIVSKTPLRISFFSGGSDTPAFYKREDGAALSVTIDKFIHVIVRKTPNLPIKTMFDVVDESDLRRGKKTANIIWGNEFSVLAGDFLFAQSFELMVETGSLEALSSLATASCKITQGEFQQMQIANKPDTSIKDYFDVIGKKTAELFGASCQSGIIVAGGNQNQQID